eukprot:scaffold260789_cov36-Tisochrysis_lutea.AAC.2
MRGEDKSRAAFRRIWDGFNLSHQISTCPFTIILILELSVATFDTARDLQVQVLFRKMYPRAIHYCPSVRWRSIIHNSHIVLHGSWFMGCYTATANSTTKLRREAGFVVSSDARLMKMHALSFREGGEGEFWAHAHACDFPAVELNAQPSPPRWAT